MKPTFILSTLLLLLSPTAQAQEHSPYAGEAAREIKALSPQQTEGYLSGAGLGFARAAELNSYPGPRHVLELADPLHLTADQRSRTQAAFEAMQAEAIRLGTRIVEKEKALDRLFAGTTARPKTVQALTEEIGSLNGTLRFVHLQAHLQMIDILRPEQIRHYDQLRGYSDDAAAHDHNH